MTRHNAQFFCPLSKFFCPASLNRNEKASAAVTISQLLSESVPSPKIIFTFYSNRRGQIAVGYFYTLCKVCGVIESIR